MELGIDISSHRSKRLDEFLDMKFDYVVTVCDHAKQTCPFFPGGKESIHKVSRTLLRLPDVRMRRSPFSGGSEMKSESGLWKPLVGKGREKG